MDILNFDIYVVAGNLTIFCGTHDDTFKSDILNSSLYATLVAAQRSSSREKSWITFKELISTLKWTLNSQTTQRLEFAPSSLLDLVVNISGSTLPAYDKQILSSAFSKINQLENDSPAISALLKKIKANSSGTAHGTYAEMTIVRSDKAVLSLQIAFETDLPIGTEILSQRLMLPIDDGKNNFHLLRSTLDGRQYGLIRDTIVKKLGSKIETDLVSVLRPSA